MCTPTTLADSETLLLAITCVSLGISSKTVFNNIGLLTNLYVRATKSPVVKNERRWIKLAQSDPFPTAGRPPTLNFGLVYTSETFDDVPDIAPSLLARVRRNDGMDSKLRLSVYYSSNLTGGKEVLLSATTFSERELLRAVSISGVLISEMSAEYCTGSKAHIQLVPYLSTQQAPLLSPHLPITASPNAFNPLSAFYVFYHESDMLTPYLDVCELTYEPLHTSAVPVLFLEHFMHTLESSVSAWQKRYELERMRQGRFVSDAEAHQHGWHKVTVTVRAGRMLPRKRMTRTLSNSPPKEVQYHTVHFPFGQEYFIETPSAETEGGSPRRFTSRQSKKPSAKKPARPGPKKVDETAPCSFVELSVEDRERTFLQPIGRTNTEYFSYYPVFGSNINASYARKASQCALPSDDTAALNATEEEYTFCSYDVVSRDFMPKRWKPVIGAANIPSDRAVSGERDGDDIDPDDDGYVFTAMQGKQYIFSKYVSNTSSTSLRADFCLEGAGIKGSACIPLAANMKQSVWTPLQLRGEDFDGVELLLDIAVSSPEGNPVVATDQMGEVCLLHRSMNGTLPADLPPHTHYRRAVADCYEWLWALGYTGQDPLLDEDGVLIPTPSNKDEDAGSAIPKVVRRGSRIQRMDAAPDSDDEEDPRHLSRVRLEDLARLYSYSDESSGQEVLTAIQAAQTMDSAVATAGDIDEPQLEDEEEIPHRHAVVSFEEEQHPFHKEESVDYPPAPMHSRATSSSTNHHSATINLASLSIDSCMTNSTSFLRRRTDYPYPLQWMLEYIRSLHEMIAEVAHLLGNLRKDITFRASPSKKDPILSVLPLNLHYQLLGIRKHTVTKEPSPATLPAVEVLHSVTVGALSPHLLGHKKGGLLFQEASLATEKNAIMAGCDKVDSKVAECGEFAIPTTPADGPYALMQSLGKDLLAFESSCLSVGRRRMYALSQALSVVASSFLLKIDLVIAGKVPLAMATRWQEHGFLIVFEGLLSVTGNERSMLEDTVSAVSALRAFQIRLCPARRPAPLEMDFAGREMVMYMGEAAFAHLPESYRCPEGAVIKLVTVLFTQGIDIQQSMVTTFGDTNKRIMKSADLQHYVNSTGFDMLNLYCFRAQPIDNGTVGVNGTTAYVQTLPSNAEEEIPDGADGGSTNPSLSTPTPSISQLLPPTPPPPPATTPRAYIDPTAHIHPMIQCLYDILRSTSLTVKNVDLLMEIERLCVMLGGVRVTFCKSGKDRTGMAVTLEQSRQLGEQFGCGLSYERLIRDANLLRVHGTRLAICMKNIGKPIYSINLLQAQFLPAVFRPPPSVCEDIMRKDNS